MTVQVKKDGDDLLATSFRGGGMDQEDEARREKLLCQSGVLQ